MKLSQTAGDYIDIGVRFTPTNELDAAVLSRLLAEVRGLNALLGILNIPNNCIGAEILPVRPGDTMMRRADHAKI